MSIAPQACHQRGPVVTCSLKLASPGKAAEVMLFCYSGISAVDAEKRSLPCSEIRIGGQRSWEYIETRLIPGRGQLAEIDLTASSPAHKLTSLQVTFSVDGQRQVAQWGPLPVQ
jgi:hypothetical protein